MIFTELRDCGIFLLSNWTTILIALIAFLISKIILNRYYVFQTFTRLGIPGPKPHFLYGNLKQMSGDGMKILFSIQEWLQMYGSNFGYFWATQPILVVTDPEMIKDVLIKDFHNFTDRPGYFRGNVGPFKTMLHSLTQNRWKEVRSVLTPTFSAKKMKQMSPLMNSGVDTFIELIEKKAQMDDEFDVNELFQGLTLHVIGECAFGLSMECQTNSSDPFLTVVRDFFNNVKKTSFTLLMSLPELKFLLNIVMLIASKTSTMSWLYWLQKQLNSVIEMRKKRHEENRMDVLQLMLNAADRKLSVSIRRSSIEDPNFDIKNAKTTNKSLTSNEIESQAFSFLLAGYETTASTLTNLAQVLAKYPEIQKKLQDEIDVHLTREVQPDYESVQSLTYMEQVIQETLRLYPTVALFVARECHEEYKTNGLTIPKGCAVLIPVWHIHHDANIWPNPEHFNPDRFSSEEKGLISQTAWMPFGIGPRNCIGMRFALLEIKVTLARFLQKYSFVKGDNFKENIEHRCTMALLQVENGVFVKVKSRKSDIKVNQ